MNSRLLISGKIWAALPLAALLSNCGSMEMLFVNPGSFDYLSCTDIAEKTVAAREREQELKMLIDRAEQGTFGKFIATTTYSSEYLKAQGDLKLLAETGQRKNCAIGSPTGGSNPVPTPQTSRQTR